MDNVASLSGGASLALFATLGAAALLAVIGLAFLLARWWRTRIDSQPALANIDGNAAPPAAQAVEVGEEPQAGREVAATTALSGAGVQVSPHPPETYPATQPLNSGVGAVTSRLALPLTWRVAWASHVGHVRQLNEDSLVALNLDMVSQRGHDPLGLFVVADGMGGQAAGEVASQTAIKVIARSVAQQMVTPLLDGEEVAAAEAMLHAACQQANKAVYDLSRQQRNDMGTTCVAALLRESVVYVANVGDSRAYIVGDASIRQVTVDHSLVERLVARGQITREEARVHQDRNFIYRHLGEKANVDIDMFSLQLHPQHWLLLCSDGLNSMIDDEAIHRAIITAPTPDRACQALIDCALMAGGDDNVSVVVLHAA